MAILIIAPSPWTSPRAQSRAKSSAKPASKIKAQPSPTARAKKLAEPENRLSLYALDAAVPGYASFSFGDYLAGSLFVAGRVTTLVLGLRARKEHLEYRSVERAARVAEAVYGPGLRFADPYGGGFRSADELGRSADRRAALLSLSLTLHLALIVGSLIYTGIRAGEINSRGLPVFDQQGGMGFDRARDGFRPSFALDVDAAPVSDLTRAGGRDTDLRLRMELIRLGF